MRYRVNFLAFWLLANTIYALVIQEFAENKPFSESNEVIVNDGSIGFLEVFALYLAGLVMYKVFFAALHLLKFKFLNLFQKYYVKEIDL